MARPLSRYQKTTLEHVRQVDAQAVKAAVCAAAKMDEADVEAFVLYGELMCNADLYSYAKDSLPGTHQVYTNARAHAHTHTPTPTSTLAPPHTLAPTAAAPKTEQLLTYMPHTRACTPSRYGTLLQYQDTIRGLASDMGDVIAVGKAVADPLHRVW